MITVIKDRIFKRTVTTYDADAFIVNDAGALILTKVGKGAVQAIPSGQWTRVSAGLSAVQTVRKEWHI